MLATGMMATAPLCWFVQWGFVLCRRLACRWFATDLLAAGVFGIDCFGPPVPTKQFNGVVMSLTQHCHPISQTPALRIGTTELGVMQIQERLAQSHHTSLRNVGCDAVGESFILWGSVSSYYAKQLAQVLAGSVVGLAKIKNRIVVEMNEKAR